MRWFAYNVKKGVEITCEHFMLVGIHWIALLGLLNFAPKINIFLIFQLCFAAFWTEKKVRRTFNANHWRLDVVIELATLDWVVKPIYRRIRQGLDGRTSCIRRILKTNIDGVLDTFVYVMWCAFGWTRIGRVGVKRMSDDTSLCAFDVIMIWFGWMIRNRTQEIPVCGHIWIFDLVCLFAKIEERVDARNAIIWLGNLHVGYRTTVFGCPKYWD